MMVTNELLANTVTTASIVLAGRNSIHTWWTGIIGCLLFGVVFYEALTGRIPLGNSTPT